jgi:TolB-like protein
LIAFLAIGFIPVVVLSWKYDVIAGRLMRDDGAPAIPSSLRRVDVAITALLLVGLSYFAFDKFVLDPARDLQRVVEARQAGRADAIVGSYGDKSIAVLPFVNMRADPEHEYFSDGISEELLNTLARIPELRVISRSTAFSFKGKDIDVTEVAKRLNVGHVLEGSVRKSGNRIRITAQLIDARTDTHLWSETYDRDFDDIFNIQDEISARVVADLKLKLLGGALQSEAVNPAAYELYLKARQLLHYELGAARSAEAAGLLEQAVELEPSWQRALFELTRAYYRQTFDEGEDGRNRKKTVALIERLEALDKRGQAALIWRGYITWLWEDDAARAAVYFEQAVAADPYNVDILRALIGFLSYLGRFDLAMSVSAYLAERDPGCAYCISGMADALWRNGRYRDAAVALESLLDWHAANDETRQFTGDAWLLAGNAEKALSHYDSMELPPDENTGRLLALYDLGRTAEFDGAFDTLREKRGPETKAAVYAWIGANDSAFYWLNELIRQEGPAAGRRVEVEYFTRIREDPRWMEFVRTYRPDDEQVPKIRFEPDLPPEIVMAGSKN